MSQGWGIKEALFFFDKEEEKKKYKLISHGKSCTHEFVQLQISTQAANIKDKSGSVLDCLTLTGSS